MGSHNARSVEIEGFGYPNPMDELSADGTMREGMRDEGMKKMGEIGERGGGHVPDAHNALMMALYRVFEESFGSVDGFLQVGRGRRERGNEDGRKRRLADPLP